MNAYFTFPKCCGIPRSNMGSGLVEKSCQTLPAEACKSSAALLLPHLKLLKQLRPTSRLLQVNHKQSQFTEVLCGEAANRKPLKSAGMQQLDSTWDHLRLWRSSVGRVKNLVSQKATPTIWDAAYPWVFRHNTPCVFSAQKRRHW